MAGSLNGLTSGASSKLSVLDPSGKVLDFSILTEFTYMENSQILEKIPMNGEPLFPKLFQGWHGTLRYFRKDNSIMDYIIEGERNYYLGGDELPLTLHHTITEIDGSTTTMQFTNVVMSLENAGSYSGTEIVEQSASWRASRCVKS